MIERSDVYRLLPAVVRERDAENGYLLQALLGLVSGQVELVREDIGQLWDDLFIETCRDWVIPYIGDLISNDALYDSSRVGGAETAQMLFTDLRGPSLRAPAAVRLRADVANTIYYRRRKGTLAMLEELARNVSGWPTHAVEFFQLLGWTQNLDHVRTRSGWADLRSPEVLDRAGGAFDELSHTVDVRPLSQLDGWMGVPKIGFFLWRLGSYPLARVPARPTGTAGRYHFSPLGNPAPIFLNGSRPRSESGLSTELEVAGPIRRALFDADLTAFRQQRPPPTRPAHTELYGLPEAIAGDATEPYPDASFFIRVNDGSVPPAFDPDATPENFQPQIICRRLDPWPTVAQRPGGKVIWVDVVAGRLLLGTGWNIQKVETFFRYGFPADMGGGPYERRPWLLRADPGVTAYRVRRDPAADPTVTHDDVQAALDAWALLPGRPNTVIRIADSRTYDLTKPILLDNRNWLVIEAENGQRPVLQTPTAGLDVQVSVPAGATRRGASLTLSGVAVEGHVHVTGDLGGFRLLHSTLVPGRKLTQTGAPVGTDPSLVVEAAGGLNRQLRIEVAFSILGSLDVPENADYVWLLDSIVDGLGGTALGSRGGGAGPRLTIERSTLLGQVRAHELEASESIFTGLVRAERTQDGCIRFSYLLPGSKTPRRFRCQPDLGVEAALADALARKPNLSASARAQIRQHIEAWLVPGFSSLRYGEPRYCQLRLTSPTEIRTGAEDGAEMGAFNQVKQPQRESNLRTRLQEYLPFGLEAGVIYVS